MEPEKEDMFKESQLPTLSKNSRGEYLPRYIVKVKEPFFDAVTVFDSHSDPDIPDTVVFDPEPENYFFDLDNCTLEFVYSNPSLVVAIKDQSQLAILDAPASRDGSSGFLDMFFDQLVNDTWTSLGVGGMGISNGFDYRGATATISGNWVSGWYYPANPVRIRFRYKNLAG